MGWLWTSETLYPCLYRLNGGDWLWCQDGSAAPRWFLDLSTLTWESYWPPD